jgi:hypothetical protein
VADGAVLWRCVVALRCGAALWRCVVALHCGAALWRCIVALHCGAALWRCVVALCCGAALWRCVVALPTCCGDAVVYPYSSGYVFDGWKEREDAVVLWNRPATYDPLIVYLPRTWLLREGWRRHGLIRFGEIPSSRQLGGSVVDV